MTIYTDNLKIFTSRHQAYKFRQSGEKVVSVCGGWQLMTEEEYRIWRQQK